MEKTIIPNSFQHPNFFIDVLDQYLTSDESKVLTHAVREILGWQQSIESRQKHISRETFLNGRVVNGKKVYGGVNLCADTLNKVLNALEKYRILVRVGSSRDPRGQLFELTVNIAEIDIDGLKLRHDTQKTRNKALSAASSAQKSTRLPHRQPKHSSATQTSYSSVTQTSNSSATQTSYSSATQTERNTVKEIQKGNPGESREVENDHPSNMTAHCTALQNAPIGAIYVEVFGKDKALQLNKTQVNLLLAIQDMEYARKAMQDLEGRAVRNAWCNIPLIRKRMEELVSLEIREATQREQAAAQAASIASPTTSVAMRSASGGPGRAAAPRYGYSKNEIRRKSLNYLEEEMLKCQSTTFAEATPAAVINL